MEMLPDWLRPTDDEVLDIKYPVTPSHREIQRITFESLFERALEQVMEGKSVKSLVESDPRGVTYGQFMRWVRSNPERSKAMDEAEEIGTDVTADELKEISDGDGLEDVQRSTLRVNTRKWLMQTRNKKKYGAEKETGSGGITVVVQRGVTAEVTPGGVLTIGPEQNKGYPVSGVTVDG